MFFPSSFEPHSPIEPQWFPRPITDSFESQLDQLERLEEDRKRRLRAIANVPAKNPIGFCGESAALPGSAAAPSSTTGNHRHNHNSYSQYRYYPPPSEVDGSASSFHRQSQEPVSTSATTSRRRHYRNVRVPRSSHNNSTSSVDAAIPTPQRDDNDPTNLSHLSHSHISHDVSNIRTSGHDFFQGSTTSFTMSSPLFHSPPFDPRGGGGGGGAGRRNSDWYQSQLQRHPMGQYPPTNTNDDDAEWTTPTNLAFLEGEDPPSGMPLDVTTPEDQGVMSTPGHGHSEDVYSQRRRGQRRRRIE